MAAMLHQSGYVRRRKTENTVSNALRLALISISAALYAAAITVTSFVPTPWGVGNFRPGVLIPAFFTVVYGPFIGGVGAAIGCFIGDLALYAFGLTNPLLSLIAGVPANFAGFYILGWLTSKHPSWRAYIINSFLAVTVGNFIAAVGVVGFFSTIVPVWASWPMELKLATVFGFTFFWDVTMIPFVIPLMPPLMRAIKPIVTSSGGGVVISELEWGEPMDVMKSAAVVGVILLAIYGVVTYTPWGNQIFLTALYKETTYWVKTLILIASVVIFIFGAITTAILQKGKIRAV